jgi:hypothetical protein
MCVCMCMCVCVCVCACVCVLYHICVCYVAVNCESYNTWCTTVTRSPRLSRPPLSPPSFLPLAPLPPPGTRWGTESGRPLLGPSPRNENHFSRPGRPRRKTGIMVSSPAVTPRSVHGVCTWLAPHEHSGLEQGRNSPLCYIMTFS